MEFAIYCRDRPGSMELRRELGEDHWSFMDRYAEELIARGPTFTDDGSIVTGSLHMVDLPDLEAAKAFAFEEPNYKAGIYDQVLIRRWRNVLGRTMWDFTRRAGSDGHFLIIGHAKSDATAIPGTLRDEQRRYLADERYAESFIALGPLLADDGIGWRGTAILAELRDRAAAEQILPRSPCGEAGLYESVEVHNWTFGGRR